MGRQQPTPPWRPLVAALTILLSAALSNACSTAHTARPLGKGKHAAHISVGGPLVALSEEQNTSIPLTTVTWKTGLTDRADFYLGWHVIESFLNKGNFFFDVGASYYLLDQRGALPGISAAFTLSPLLSHQASWAAMDLQITASWTLGPRQRHLIYLGFHNYFSPVRSQLIANSPYTFSPYLGGQLRLGPQRQLGLSVELKWLRPYQDRDRLSPSFLAPGNQGALSLVAGLTLFIGSRAGHRSEQVESPQGPQDTSKSSEEAGP
ncbi:MAG: hypothetical protein CMP23_16360 [Rickettsiales bacterium]|nr:hypothetical protein [Rickettsiales bacterium]|tara:strand:+ start:1602 stop:2393 length:792 start_codon:yes stop_codon:yes gene_type:complete